MNTVFHLKLALISLLLVFFYACKKETADPEPAIPERSVLIYIGANNNLHDDALITMEHIVEGAKSVTGGSLVVYLKTQFNSCLLKIGTGKSNVRIDTIKQYASGNSSDPDFMRKVIQDARVSAPARSYGLVLWSHATGWEPADKVHTESFGSDDFREMDIKDLKDALPDDWEYIMFDACSMSSVEVVYELKGKSKYILASPSEVLSSSFPYDRILPHLFEQEEGLKTVASKFIGYYKEQSDLYASATVALINPKEVERMAALTKELLDRKRPVFPYSLDNVQVMDFDEGGLVTYDFMDFLENNYEESDLLALKEQLAKVVLYKDHTDKFFDVPIKSYCGLSIYSPTANDPYTNYYTTLNWSSASDWYLLFQ
ncbi:hypothetical protein SAMN05518672_108157 [Chitinophaga sp. CF118]|uniref:clostripain-related cysteine peptidase n=1 Tax=Chitinophaga sp. CF118 TaxID=1884367 RepID=UPI0008EE7ED6|nr:clostripain-related cysteine peptidase [Chitinophaga sp. CF118]SFE62751.1 hypothetical protein SAMN05518672_108157 [Chitinophaga sp. CF118]